MQSVALTCPQYIGQACVLSAVTLLKTNNFHQAWSKIIQEIKYNYILYIITFLYLYNYIYIIHNYIIFIQFYEITLNTC